MSKKSRLFLILAVIAWLVSGSRLIPSIAFPDDVGDFFLGFAVAMMVGMLVNWRDST